MKTDTPIVDAAEFFCESEDYRGGGVYVVRGEDARELERDRATLRAALVQISKHKGADGTQSLAASVAPGTLAKVAP